ncbi:ribosome biogenesis GTPase [Natronospira proteinivora]|uniref:Small ribosomal subunit biogenesis GTPase RsgA n=1 Tax=Natronospira proteinivora TaxID=1807133 RepID=A0ABT1G5B8_9GAMM|nr:ribosome small subunit-dependent GTPase A [Natronospira proteinivora]MCP1726493.1 ribosome biogenesis GTPase [Natronospira proteinivora]
MGHEKQQPGQVLASYGSHALVRLADGKARECSIKGKRLRPVAGDRVQVVLGHKDEAVLSEILPRQSELAKQSGGGRRKQVLAANLDLLVVMIAPEPAPEPGIVDRYLAAAEALGLDAAVVFNKEELAPDGPPDWLSEFRALGYPVFTVSAARGDGLSSLTAHLARHTAALVGQSGVGKSTLLNALLGESVARTAAISEKHGEGRHTTTTAYLHDLPSGAGGIIDSPGVRDFHLWPIAPESVAGLFREIRETSVGCRFNDCQHDAEPGCAVRASVESGEISARRYRSYLRLREQMRQLKERNPDLL